MSMTNAERTELMQLIRKRERVMKSAAQKRSADMLAEFDGQSASIYEFDDDKVWAEAMKRADAACEEAKKIIAERCAELGIPKEFSPEIHLSWYGRGQNAMKERRAELRRAAQSKIKAMEADAITKIENISLETQTTLLSEGMSSDAAKRFLVVMATIETLMPAIDTVEIRRVVDASHMSSAILS